MFVLNQLDGEKSSYQMPSATIIKGKPDIDRLKWVLNELVKRHEVLRTSFDMENDELVQKVYTDVEINPVYKEASEEDTDELIRDIAVPFDLTEVPIFRSCLVRLLPKSSREPAEDRYLMIFATHHIVMDGLSLNILANDFIRLYRGEYLPPLQKQYKDFAAWHREWLKTEELQKQEAYWVKKFSDEIPVLNLPTDYPRPLMRSPEGNILYYSMSEQETGKIKNLARKEGVTLTIFLIAAYNLLLHKLTGQEDIVVGIPVSGRPMKDYEHVLGMFVNTLAIRNFPRRNLSFREFLKNVKANAIKDYDHQDYPLEVLVDKLGLVRTQRDMSRNALFDTLFVYEKADDRVVRTKELAFISYDIKKETSMFDLTTEVIEQQGIFNMSMEYSTLLFKKETIERWNGYFQKLLREIVKNPDAPLSELDILSPDERHLLVTEFNDTHADFPEDKTTVDLFEEQAARTPDSVAVIYENVSLTYRQMNEQANQIAHYLRDVHKIQPEDRIGLLLERSEWIVAGILGILKAGGAYVPVDLFYPPDRIGHIMDNSNCRLILTEKKHLNSPYTKDSKIPIFDIAKTGEGFPVSNPVHTAGPSNLVYVVYTSGSTGVPKGVMIEHRSLVNLTFAYREAYGLEKFDELRLMQMASMSFDIFFADMLRVLTIGGQLIICPADTRIDLPALYSLMARHRINIFESTPGLILPLMDYIYESGLDIGFLKVLISSSDSLQAEHYKKLVDRFGKTLRVINGYGMTEGTIDSSYFDDREFEMPPGAVTLIAKPLFQNARYYILDPDCHPLPIGVPGEIHVGGVYAARGYLDNEEMTAERFIPSPFIPGDRLYKTGDMARWLPDGNMEFLGRIDNQIQIRGYRVELEEIENRLLKHEAVKETLVLARDLGDNAMELVAYIVKTEEADPDLTVADYRAYLSQFLPDYMIPAYFVSLDEFPLTPNDKIDRKVLPIPDRAAMSLGTEYEAPRNALEETIVRIWEEVLGREKIGIHDNYFALGGDSIKGIQVISRLLKENLKLHIRDVFQYPTVFELAGRITESEPRAEQVPVTGKVPLGASQSKFFRIHDNDQVSGQSQYIILYSKSGFSEKGVKTVLEKLQEHHDALRMKFDTGETVSQKNCGSDYPFSFETLNIQNTENALSEIELHADRIRNTMNIKDGPLMKSVLFKSDQGDYLLIIIHCLVTDRVSWKIFIEDFVSGYKQHLSEQAVKLPLKTDSFKKWSEAIHEYSKSKEILQQKDYWENMDSVPVKSLKEDNPAHEPQRSDYSLKLSREDTQRLLTDVNHAYNTDINDILLTALARTMKKQNSSHSTLISLEGDGREKIQNTDISRTMGYFAVEYPFVLELPSSDDIGYQIKSVKESLRQVPDGGIGYGTLKYLGDKISSDKKPSISFNYLKPFDENITKGLFDIIETATSFKFQVSSFKFQVSSFNSKLQIKASYNKSLFKQESIEKILSDYKQELLTIADHCQGKETTELTPADLTYSDLSIDDLDGIFS
ncbi:MAG: amino acid adenylation domain-containing protein [Desulfobacterales bacterium]|nr:amino acid adenylation domain-containing protein [Desulfobacterales bacterium]